MVLISTLALPGAAMAQPLFLFIPYNVSTPDPEGYITALRQKVNMPVDEPTVCRDGKGVEIADHTLPDGGFIQQYSSLRTDTSASITGFCDGYIWGDYWRTEERDISSVSLRAYPPTLLPTHQPVYPNTYTQSMDTRIDGTTSGPVTGVISERGVYRFTFLTHALSTSCNIPTDSAEVEKTLNAVACSPRWWIVGTSPEKTVHAPTTSISVYIPSTMSELFDSADQAITDWNTAMSNTGVSLARVTSPCGLGGNCVNVEEGTVSSGCAVTAPGAIDSDGTLTTPSAITLPSAWRNRTVERNQRTVAHELGHVLGLNHNSCAVGDSIMSIPLNCESTDGLTLSPTETDVLPTKSSTYGSHVQKYCGS